jgi:hypothetical protein
VAKIKIEFFCGVLQNATKDDIFSDALQSATKNSAIKMLSLVALFPKCHSIF